MDLGPTLFIWESELKMIMGNKNRAPSNFVLLDLRFVILIAGRDDKRTITTKKKRKKKKSGRNESNHITKEMERCNPKCVATNTMHKFRH